MIDLKKYKVGDKVLFIGDSDCYKYRTNTYYKENFYNPGYMLKMDKFIGTEVTIASIDKQYNIINIQECRGYYNYSSLWFNDINKKNTNKKYY